MGLYFFIVRIQLHSVKRLSMKTGSFVVISCSKLDPYQDERTCNKQLTQWVFFIIYCKLQNNCRISFVVASLSKSAGYDNTYTTCVLYFMIITHSDPLCKFSIYKIVPVSFTSLNIIHWHSTKCTDKYM